ncbi:MAG: 4-hydroxythreonine-4-phosphate dehydrogenase PdxA [Acidobacteriia bacterium]|nr:4-hydroxythreonine-4-phosphate dehydrogenase PdxA [Terriglobia bacterium]
MPNSSESAPLQLGITTGDPAGIGPEVSLRAAQNPGLRGRCRLLLFGDADLMRRQAATLGLSCDFEVISADALGGSVPLPERGIVHIPASREHITPGRGSRAGGEAAARNIVECVRACRAGRLHAMVTAPLNKTFFNEAGYPFPGHTEFLAHLTGVSRFAMAFLTERLKVVLVTIHLPLRAAIDSITSTSIMEKLEILLEEFPRLGLPCRRIAVAGLNPHAGEAGLLGREEIEQIMPALAQARARYADVAIEGPIPADTLFHRAAQGEFDAVLSLYHDQGLTPIKLLGFGEAANVTLGLPFIRTSVDHGTAYEIAGRGCARPDSMIAAIRWALRLKSKS